MQSFENQGNKSLTNNSVQRNKCSKTYSAKKMRTKRIKNSISVRNETGLRTNWFEQRTSDGNANEKNSKTDQLSIDT